MTTTRKLSGRARKAVLLVHVLSAAAWLGIDLALGILVVVALSTSDINTAGVAIQAIDLFAIWPMFWASIVCMISGVVRQLESLGESEVSSDQIGEFVMEGLKNLDDVAFVRFASVYKNFSAAEDFSSFLRELADDARRPGPDEDD